MTPERLAQHGFRDVPAALRNLQLLGVDPAGWETLLSALGRSADPDQGLNLLERFVRSCPSPQALFAQLQADPRARELLAIVCGGSAFLAEVLIREPAWFDWTLRALGRARTAVQIDRDLREAGEADALRVAKRRELLLLGARDLLRLATVEQTLAGLSVLAEALIGRACELSAAVLGMKRPGFAVLGLGKLGGGELNFSSDVDLLYLSGSALSRGDGARRLAREVTAALGEVTSEGHVYRVDLRLRPEGRMGEIAPTLAAAESYYRDRASSWERLALVKARLVGGDPALGRRFLEDLRPFVFGRPFGPDAFREMREVKHRLDRRTLARGELDRNVKLGLGGIREVEFVVHSLQLRFAQRRPRIRKKSTLGALEALRAGRLLPGDEADALQKAYLFLRDVENKLQMVADAQTHTLPEEPLALRSLARRLGYGDAPGLTAERAFLGDYRSFTEAAHRVFQSVFEVSD